MQNNKKDKYSRYELNQSPFYYLQSQKKLCKLLRVGKNKLKQLTQSESLYREKQVILKKKERSIVKPRPELKIVQKRIEDILKRIKIPTYIQSPVKNRSYITNAQVHINAKQVRNLDIEKYFTSTSSKFVYYFFYKYMKCSKDVAAIITKLVTYKGCLPTGSLSSPIISYYSHIDMWEKINNLVKNENCTLSVYLDDITISGNCVPDRLIWEIKKQFHRYGLSNNKQKEKNYINQKACEITGVIVTAEGKLKLPHRQHLKIYQLRKLINSEEGKENKQELLKKLRGIEGQLRYIQSINNN